MSALSYASYFDTADGEFDPQSIIDFHRATFGGFKMEGEEGPEDGAAGDEPPGSENEGTNDDGSQEPGDEDKQSEDGEMSVEDYKSALKRARGDAANYRTRLRETEKQLEGVKSLDEVDSLINQIRKETAAQELQLVRENVALKFNLPEDLATALKGSSRDELEAHAKVLSKYAPQDDGQDEGTPKGGLRPDESGDDFDPVAAARAARTRRY